MPHRVIGRTGFPTQSGGHLETRDEPPESTSVVDFTQPTRPVRRESETGRAMQCCWAGIVACGADNHATDDPAQQVRVPGDGVGLGYRGQPVECPVEHPLGQLQPRVGESGIAHGRRIELGAPAHQDTDALQLVHPRLHGRPGDAQPPRVLARCSIYLRDIDLVIHAT